MSGDKSAIRVDFTTRNTSRRLKIQRPRISIVVTESPLQLQPSASETPRHRRHSCHIYATRVYLVIIISGDGRNLRSRKVAAGRNQTYNRTVHGTLSLHVIFYDLLFDHIRLRNDGRHSPSDTRKPYPERPSSMCGTRFAGEQFGHFVYK